MLDGARGKGDVARMNKGCAGGVGSASGTELSSAVNARHRELAKYRRSDTGALIRAICRCDIAELDSTPHTVFMLETLREACRPKV